MKRVLITEPIARPAVELLRSCFEVAEGGPLAGCDGVLVRSARVSEADMDANPQLKVIAKHGMGLDTIDVEAATRRGIAVVNAPYSNLNAVAEHIVMLLMALSKRTVRMDRLTRTGAFSQRNAYRSRELRGSTVGFIGMGKISRRAVEIISGFGMEILACDPFIAPAGLGELPVELTDAEEVYRRSDFVIVHTSLTQDTFHLIGAPQFRAMKSTACFINASRGAVVDEAALIAALEAGEIAGAGLDVFEEEPPRDDNPLFRMENVILSPHNAALTDRALLAMALDSAQGVKDFLEGKVPQYLCNPEILTKA